MNMKKMETRTDCPSCQFAKICPIPNDDKCPVPDECFLHRQDTEVVPHQRCKEKRPLTSSSRQRPKGWMCSFILSSSALIVSQKQEEKEMIQRTFDLSFDDIQEIWRLAYLSGYRKGNYDGFNGNDYFADCRFPEFMRKILFSVEPVANKEVND